MRTPPSAIGYLRGAKKEKATLPMHNNFQHIKEVVPSEKGTNRAT